MARKKDKRKESARDESETASKLPLNKLVSNRDKALRKARDLFEAGKVDEARKAFERAEYWQAQIDKPC